MDAQALVEKFVPRNAPIGSALNDWTTVEKDEHGKPTGRRVPATRAEGCWVTAAEYNAARSQVIEFASYLNGAVHGVDEPVRALMLAAICGENVLFYGPPGTGKTLLANAVFASLPGATGFSTALSPETSEKNVFGAIDCAKLSQGVTERNMAGYLPTAEVGFLDEITRAGKAVLDGLLSYMNDRTIRNGGKMHTGPTRFIMAAANHEFPRHAAALQDRFGLRVHMPLLKGDSRREFLENFDSYGQAFNCPPRILVNAFRIMREYMRDIPITLAAREAMLRFADELEGIKLAPSQRTMAKWMTIFRAAAAITKSGAPFYTGAQQNHAQYLRFCCWTNTQNEGAVRDAALDAAMDPNAKAPFANWKGEVLGLKGPQDGDVHSNEDVATKIAKIRALRDDATQLAKLGCLVNDDARRLGALLHEWEKLQARLLA